MRIQHCPDCESRMVRQPRNDGGYRLECTDPDCGKLLFFRADGSQEWLHSDGVFRQIEREKRGRTQIQYAESEA